MWAIILYSFLFFSFFPLVGHAQLNLQVARELSGEALSLAEARGKCVAVAVVDEGSNLLNFERSPCAPLGSIETSIQKAKASALFRKPTSDFVAAVKSGRLGILTATGVVAVEGGLPIYLKGAFLGGIGVGGATSVEDEELGKAAIKKIEMKLKEEK